MDQHQQAQAINTAFDAAGIGFKAKRSDVLAELKNNGEREVAFDKDGNPHIKYDGQILTLSEALHRFAYDRRDLADQRTLPKQDEGRGRPGIASKADFATVAEKTAYIREHGIDAYERLPVTTPKTSEVRFREDFFALPTAEKARRLQETPDIIESLPNRPKQPFAQFQANLEKAKTRHQAELDAMHREQFPS